VNYRISANSAAACTNGTAVATGERSAAKVSFQQHYGKLPPHKNINSADVSLLAAVQFGRNNAINVVIAVTTATEGSPLGQHLSHLMSFTPNRH
jgi:hypothetical protein